MTRGFDTQPTTFAPIPKAAPKPQAVGARLPAQDKLERPPPAEPRSFERREP